MNIKNKLEAVLAYYDRTRGVGHTRVAKAGIDGREVLVMCQNQASCGPYSVGHDMAQAKACVIHRPDVWQSYNLPLVWDNLAIQTLCAEALKEIEFQKQCLRDSQGHCEKLREEAKFQEDRAIALYNYLNDALAEVLMRKGWIGLKLWFRDTFGGAG